MEELTKEEFSVLVENVLEIVGKEKADVIGKAFVEFICLKKEPQLEDYDDKVAWNIFMFACTSFFEVEKS